MKKIIKKEAPYCKKDELVELLLKKIPGCFDDVPRRALNRGAVGKLVDEILGK